MVIQGDQIGVHYKNGKEVKDYAIFDTDKTPYCWLHGIDLTSDWKSPNVEDQKKLNAIKLEEFETKDKDGTTSKFRKCRKCGVMVKWTKPR